MMSAHPQCTGEFHASHVLSLAPRSDVSIPPGCMDGEPGPALAERVMQT